MSEPTRGHNYGSTFVPAVTERRPHLTSLQTIDVQNILPLAAHTGHARQDDDAMSHAKATLLISSAYIVAAGIITGGMLLVAWLFRALGDGWGLYVYGGLIVWGVCVLASLYGNRRQSLHHSPTGVTHAEIDSRERLARHAIDTHAKLLLKKWDIDND